MLESNVGEKPKARKVLTLANPPESEKQTPEKSKRGMGEDQFVPGHQAFYMVWKEGGDAPKRMYGPDEKWLAAKHAKILSEEHGVRFHVFRSWRISKPPT